VFHHYIPRMSALLATGETLLFFVLMDACVSANVPGHWPGIAQMFQGLTHAIGFSAWTVAITVLAMGATGLYNLEIMFEMDAVLARMALSSSMAFAAISFIELALSSAGISGWTQYRALTVVLPICALVSLLVRGFLGRLVSGKDIRRRVLVIGRGRSAAKVAEMGSADRYRFKIIGYVDIGADRDRRPLEPLFPASSIATPEAALTLVESNGVDAIVVASDERRGLPHRALLQCRMNGISVEDFATFWESHAGSVDLDSLQPSWLTYCEGFSMNRNRLVAKICFDYLVASLLLLTTAPITLLTAVVIKATSDGPVLFRQERVGRNGKIFSVLKFRSMAVDAEKAGPQWAKVHDTRVTPVGRFIRKVRIDEIPQVLNILKGDMSFVGPRPERPQFVPQLSQAIPYFDERHRVKPGLSGWAQINYPYGASVEDARNKLSYDLYYLKNGSIFLDFVILLRTVHVILWPHGAR
jgi:sugar transferase (PEP-CTERM system associated)